MPTTKRVLCIDGGGMRGIYAAAYLHALSQRYAKAKGVPSLDIGKGFDLIVGASTGAIISCALAVGLPLDRVIALYREQGRRIFPSKVPKSWGVLLQIGCRSKSLARGAAALERALTCVFQSATLGEIWSQRGIALAVPAVEMASHRAWVFKTPHLGGHRDDGYSLVDVCLAATAAPVFRSLARLQNPTPPGAHVFADGGLWANNPVLVGMVDALALAQPEERIEIFCLGTCPRPGGDQVGETGLHRGFMEWRFGAEAMTLALDAQEHGFEEIARKLAPHFKRDCQVVRFPHGEVSAALMPHLDLDETSDDAMDALVNQAQIDAYATSSRLDHPSHEGDALLKSMLCSIPGSTGACGNHNLRQTRKQHDNGDNDTRTSARRT